MSINIRKGSSTVARAMVQQYNLLRQSVATLQTKFHVDVTASGTTGSFESPAATTATCATPNAVDLPTSIALANSLQTLLAKHAADGVSTNASNSGAHLVPDTTNAPTLAAIAKAADLPTTQTLANGVKAFLNAHFVQASVHVTNDATNTVATVNATDLPSSIALLNACKTAYNAHILSAPAGLSLNLVDP